jgi:hypothetical protein
MEGSMTINFVTKLLGGVGGVFIAISIGDAINEVDWSASPGLTDLFMHLVIFSFGMILLGMSAILVSLCGIDVSTFRMAGRGDEEEAAE